MDPNIIAFRMSLRSVDAHFYEHAPARVFCSECDSVLDSSYVPEALEIHSGGAFALGSSFDGKALCSTVMKELMRSEGLAVSFWEVNSNLGLHHFEPRKKLMFDVKRRKTQFIAPCSRCGGFAEVIGSQPVFLRNVSGPILNGLFRTDIEFGTGRSKGPELIVGIQTKAVLYRVKFGGCTYLPIRQN